MAEQNLNQLNISSDATVITKTTKRLSAVEFLEEDIEIKPSSELIPDEYEHRTNETSVVHLFHTDWAFDCDNTENIYKTLVKCGYKIPQENIHNLFQTDLSELLKNICENVKEQDEGLIMFFSAVFKRDDTLITCKEDKKIEYEVHKIWSYFTSNNCPNLKNKPKIFIFQMSKELSKVQHDALLLTAPDIYYNTPAEADILIIFNKTQDHAEEYRRKFVDDLCDFINDYGKSEDLLTLVTCTSQEERKRPLIISTLTKKFYINVSEERGHRLFLQEDIKALTDNVNEIHSKLNDYHKKSVHLDEVPANGKKKKTTAWDAILKKTSSFRNALSPKRERPQNMANENEAKKNDKGKETKSMVSTDHAQIKPSSSKAADSKGQAGGAQRKLSTSNKGLTIPVTKPKNMEPPKPSPKAKRPSFSKPESSGSRTTSVSGSKNDPKEKKPWRP